MRSRPSHGPPIPGAPGLLSRAPSILARGPLFPHGFTRAPRSGARSRGAAAGGPGPLNPALGTDPCWGGGGGGAGAGRAAAVGVGVGWAGVGPVGVGWGPHWKRDSKRLVGGEEARGSGRGAGRGGGADGGARPHAAQSCAPALLRSPRRW